MCTLDTGQTQSSVDYTDNRCVLGGILLATPRYLAELDPTPVEGKQAQPGSPEWLQRRLPAGSKAVGTQCLGGANRLESCWGWLAVLTVMPKSLRRGEGVSAPCANGEGARSGSAPPV